MRRAAQALLLASLWPAALPAQAPPAAAPTAPAAPAAPTSGDEPFPSLARALGLAREQAPAVVSSRATLRWARAGYAGARLGPVGNPYTEIVTDRGLGPQNRQTLSATLWLPLDVWGQRSRRVAEVDARVAWQGSSLEATRAHAAAEAAAAYGAAVVEAERARLFEAILAGARAEADIFRERVEARDATEQDSAMASLEVARNAVQLLEIRADVQRSLTDLARVTGVDAYAAPAGVPLRPPALPADLTPDALALRSPQVQALQGEARYHLQLQNRLASEAKTPFSLMLSTGRGDSGDFRVGGGVALTLPFFRSFQGERAQAEADQQRAQAEAGAQRSAARSALTGLERERRQVAAAIVEVEKALEPAGQAAVVAAEAMLKAGKGDLLRVLTARRDLAMLRTRKLDLIRREWALYGQFLALTGAPP